VVPLRIYFNGHHRRKRESFRAGRQLFTKGAVTEDSLVYQEPRDWLVPARHYLGNALLKEKKYKEAEKVFLRTLPINRVIIFLQQD